MRATRLRAVAAIREVGLCCTLAVVVTKGVSEGEIRGIVHFAIDNIDVVRAINFQSATRLTGRFGLDENYQGYGLQELIELIEAETGIEQDTFLSEHLGHPSCNVMSPVFIVNGRLEPLFKYITEEDLLAFLGEDRRDKILATIAGKKDFFFRYLLNRRAWKLIVTRLRRYLAPTSSMSFAANISLFLPRHLWKKILWIRRGYSNAVMVSPMKKVSSRFVLIITSTDFQNDRNTGTMAMIDRNPQFSLFLLFLFFMTSGMVGCTTVRRVTIEQQLSVDQNVFSHEYFDKVLQKYVNDDGMVDYLTLQASPQDLDAYYYLLSTRSPDSHPELFPSEQDKLAYWINAYNAGAMKAVLAYYPIDSVLEVNPPRLFFFLTEKAGFFSFNGSPLAARPQASITWKTR